MKMRMQVLTHFKAPKAPQTIVTMVPESVDCAGWVIQMFMPLNDTTNIFGPGTIVDIEVQDHPQMLAKSAPLTAELKKKLAGSIVKPQKAGKSNQEGQLSRSPVEKMRAARNQNNS